MLSLRGLLVVIPAIGVLCARLANGRPHINSRRVSAVPIVTVPDHVVTQALTGEALPPLNTTYEFDQLIDHSNPSLGTFKQRFWHTWEWYEAGKQCLISTSFLRAIIHNLL